MTAHDLIQLVVGEIGRDRRETLYEMQYSELILIVRGYRHRGVLHYQLLREILFCTLFSFRENKFNKTSEDIWPLYFDRYKTAKREVQLSDDEVNELLDDMAAFTEYLQKEAKK